MEGFRIMKGDLITCQLYKKLKKIKDFKGSCGGGSHDWTLILECGHEIHTQDYRM